MDRDPTRIQCRAGTLGAAAIVALATAYYASRPATMSVPARTPPAPQASQGLFAAAGSAAPPANAAGVHTTAPIASAAAHDTPLDSEAATVAEYVSAKYQLLLDDLRYLDTRQQAQLRRDLLAREQFAGQGDQEDALAAVEGRIRGLLQAGEEAIYLALRESDEELLRLNEYAGGIAGVAPLSDADRKAILKTKLAYKEHFRRLLQDSGLRRADLSAAEREYAYAIASRALQDYRSGYLQEVRQYLAGEEQFILLSNFEAGEFKAELARLRSMANVPTPPGG